MTKQNAAKRFMVGLIILLVGSALLLRSLGLYGEIINEYFFRWEMILIALGAISLFSHDGPGPGIILLLLGTIFYTRDYIELPYEVSFWQLLIAIIFIFSGIIMIFRRKRNFTCRQYDYTEKKNNEDSNAIDEVAVFGGCDKTIVTNNFRGGRILTVFGGANINLTRSKLAPGKNYVDVLAVLGGIKLIVPEDWNVKISTVSIFGGFSDKHRVYPPEAADDEKPQLIIKGFIFFGGGEIKSY